MTSIPFCKFHGFGNDYIVLERSHLSGITSLPEFTKKMCHRHTGVGSDGIAVLEKLDGTGADYSCEIVNPDGSIAGFSGNGTRCAVACLYYQGLWSDPKLKLRTKSGVKNYTLIESPAIGQYWFEAEIGKPKFASDEIPVRTAEKTESVIDQPLTISGQQFQFSAANVGNPVACMFVEDFDFDWRAIGRQMEVHKIFPERANIVFLKVTDRENIEIKIWERGAGETSASGTCSSGAAILSAFTGRTGRNVSVHSEGGTTNVGWLEDGEILLTGRADLAFCGEWQS